MEFYKWLEDSSHNPKVIFYWCQVFKKHKIIRFNLGYFDCMIFDSNIPLYDRKGDYVTTLLMPPYYQRSFVPVVITQENKKFKLV